MYLKKKTKMVLNIFKKRGILPDFARLVIQEASTLILKAFSFRTRRI